MLVRIDGFGMNKDGYDRSRGWLLWRQWQLEDWVSGYLVVVVAVVVWVVVAMAAAGRVVTAMIMMSVPMTGMCWLFVVVVVR